MRPKDGRGPQTDKATAAKFLYRPIFEITTFGFAFYQSNLSTTIHQKIGSTTHYNYATPLRFTWAGT
jgi:hypothetical protein